MMSVKATVPPGIMSGMPFRVQVGASLYQVVCPPGAYPGMEIIVQVPASAIPVAVPVGYQQPPPSHHRHHRHSQTPVLVPSVPVPPPPPPQPQPMPVVAPRPPPRVVTGPRVLCCKNHIVDENSPEMQEHNIKTMCTCVRLRLTECGGAALTPRAADEGEEAILVAGGLQSGLPSPYDDYVELQFDDGRRGKVSKYLLRMAASS